MKKVWKWFNGKKRNIALIYWTVLLPALPIIFDKGVPDSLEKISTILGYLLAGLGLGHSVMKPANQK